MAQADHSIQYKSNWRLEDRLMTTFSNQPNTQHMMDLETIEGKAKLGSDPSGARLSGEQPRRTRVVLQNNEPVTQFDRNNPPAEIAIKVSVFNLDHGMFDPPARFFVLSDCRLSEFIARLRKEFGFMEPRDVSKTPQYQYTFFFENILLETSKRFAELGFIPGDHFYYCPKMYLPSKTTGALKSYIDFVLRKHEVPNPTALPGSQPFFHMDNNQFLLKPSYSALCRMSFFEMGNIPNFAVENKHGRVQFLEPVDLRHCNLSQVIRIEPNLIEVYPEGCAKPKPSHGLNVKAHLFFYNLRSQKQGGDEETNGREFEAKLRKWVATLDNATFLKYDPKSFILQLEVAHF